MNPLIKSLNLTSGEVLTLEKFTDRMEYSAFVAQPDSRVGECTCYVMIYVDLPCPLKGACDEFAVDPCDCKGPVGYINCHPYRG